MTRFQATRLFVILAMLLGIAGGPAIAPPAACQCAAKTCAPAACSPSMCCHCHMACCARRSAEEKPAPVQQRAGQELAAAVTAAPFSLLFAIPPTEAKRAPRALFAAGHSPAPLAANCVWLI